MILDVFEMWWFLQILFINCASLIIIKHKWRILFLKFVHKGFYNEK